jgi:phosphoglycerate dehydrogenase-like enzyme
MATRQNTEGGAEGDVARIVLAANPNVVHLFNDVATRLSKLGIATSQYDSAEACIADLENRRQAVAMLAMHDFPLTRDFLVSMPALCGVLSFVTGTEGYDEQAATELGIVIANGQIPENFHSMAEATIMLLLAAFYDLRGAEHALRGTLGRSGEFRASMLMGKSVGIIGFGKIANAIVDRLSGWGIDLQVYAPRLRSPLPPGVRRVELEDLLRTSEAVLLLANLNPDSRHLLNGERLRLIKPGAVLVNTARGGLIDEAELYRVAAEGRFKAVALDTFEVEPLPLESPLRELPNAILTGHNVGHTAETRHALIEVAVDNLARLRQGLLPTNIRNSNVVARWRTRWDRSRAATDSKA